MWKLFTVMLNINWNTLTYRVKTFIVVLVVMS